jgi:hypothetical protein
MSDIALNLNWDIDSNGDIEFFVSSKGSDNSLASFTLTEEDIAEELSEDLQLFDEGESSAIFHDWEQLAAGFEYYAQQINTLINEAKEKRGYRL